MALSSASKASSKGFDPVAQKVRADAVDIDPLRLQVGQDFFDSL